MAKEFDIYLRRHLVESDLLVYSIPYHEGISVSNRLILEAALTNYALQKFAAAQRMDTVLVSHIDQMIKRCLEKLRMETVLDASAEFKAYYKLFLEDAPVIIDTPALETIAQIFDKAENDVVIATKPLITKISTSTGRGYFPLLVDAAVSDTVKFSLLSPESVLVPEAGVDIRKFDYMGGDTSAVIASSATNLCRKLSFDGSTAVEIVALLIDTDIRHSLGKWYDGVKIGSDVAGTQAWKFITANTVVSIMQEALGKLVKILYPEDSPVIIDFPDVTATMMRHRTLGDMDGLTLADFDHMTLKERDYIAY